MAVQFYHNFFYQNFISLPSTIIKTVKRNCRGQKFEPEVKALSVLVRPGAYCLDGGRCLRTLCIFLYQRWWGLRGKYIVSSRAVIVIKFFRS